jgi:hypothetical protein
MRTIISLAIALATTATALAETKHPVNAQRDSVYESRNGFIGTDPDANVRHELRRDGGMGRW